MPQAISRRNLLFRGTPPTRPPWHVSDSRFTTLCSRCGDCIKSCPEGILTLDRAGFPQVDFSRGECTFCKKCLEICQDGALLAPPAGESAPPWYIKANIGSGCLAHKGVFCRACGDCCEPRSLRFKPRLGAAELPEVHLASCSGCGACVAACPTNAITMATEAKAHAA
ncbi:MAG: ferredoxin-type protein NapF [Magnetococcales bacterium]|nr:ferredoxin-type protein NapF [Magnetococcales bacterium]